MPAPLRQNSAKEMPNTTWKYFMAELCLRERCVPLFHGCFCEHQYIAVKRNRLKLQHSLPKTGYMVHMITKERLSRKLGWLMLVIAGDDRI